MAATQSRRETLRLLASGLTVVALGLPARRTAADQERAGAPRSYPDPAVPCRGLHADGARRGRRGRRRDTGAVVNAREALAGRIGIPDRRS